MLLLARFLILVTTSVAVGSCGGSSGDASSPTGVVRWEPPLTVQEAVGISGQPLAAIDADGTATLLWNRLTGTGAVSAILAARSRGTAGWTEPVELETDATTLQSFTLALPQAADEPLAVWVKQDVQSPALLREASFDRAWSPPQTLPSSGYAGAGEFVGSTRGEVFGIWAEYDGSRYIVAAAKRDGTGQWSRTADVATTEATQNPEPVVAADDTGQAVALWVEGTPPRIRAARLASGQAVWSVPVAIDAGNAASSTPRIVFAGGSTFAAAWDQTLDQRLSLHATRFDGAQWLPPVALDSDNGNGAGGAQLASDGQGHAMAMWARIEGGSASFWSATLDASGWRAPLQVIGPTNRAVRSGPVVGMDRSGWQWVAWNASGGLDSGVEYAVLQPGSGRWTTPVRLSDASGVPAPPALAVNGNGQAVISWFGVVGDRRVVQARIGRRP